ncbi:MAG: hypothetical protein JWM26_934 [Betaproteobacteria bacterium]|nr:hypothetical protein [Betaproteobacteria bacterium]
MQCSKQLTSYDDSAHGIRRNCADDAEVDAGNNRVRLNVALVARSGGTMVLATASPARRASEPKTIERQDRKTAPARIDDFEFSNRYALAERPAGAPG